MNLLRTALPVLLLASTGAVTAQPANHAATPAAMVAEQRAALDKFARMDGVWRGPAWTLLPDGRKHEITQTERVGPFLDGSVKVVEGRGYEPDGKVSFNAFGVISYDVASKGYRLRSHAQGRYGDYMITPTDDGYVWEIPLPQGMIRYTAVIRDGVLREVGDRIMPGREPVRFFEMTLTRLGNSDWPAAGAVPAK